jgi:hypothetical protein
VLEEGADEETCSLKRAVARTIGMMPSVWVSSKKLSIALSLRQRGDHPEVLLRLELIGQFAAPRGVPLDPAHDEDVRYSETRTSGIPSCRAFL